MKKCSTQQKKKMGK